jgi:predicted adenylyl cyclase CyaB
MKEPRRNIEIKARVTDLEEVLAAALALPARDAGVMRQVDTYFYVSRGRLKLREIDGVRAELIFYHRPDLGEAKRSDYRIVAVEEAAAARTLLEAALGVRARVEKERRLLLYRHTRIHLDTVVGLGTFVELETVLDGIDEADGRAECAEVAQALGIDGGDLLEGSYGDMVLFLAGVPIF